MASASTRVSSDDAPPPLPRPSLSRMSARSALASRASSRSGNLPRRARRSGMGRSNARGGGAVGGGGDPAARPATTSSRRSAARSSGMRSSRSTPALHTRPATSSTRGNGKPSSRGLGSSRSRSSKRLRSAAMEQKFSSPPRSSGSGRSFRKSPSTGSNLGGAHYKDNPYLRNHRVRLLAIRKKLQNHFGLKYANARGLFAALDIDKDGVISKADFMKGVKMQRFPVDDDECHEMFNAIDANRDGVLQYHEVVEVFEPKSLASIGVMSKAEVDRMVGFTEFTPEQLADLDPSAGTRPVIVVRKPGHTRSSNAGIDVYGRTVHGMQQAPPPTRNQELELLRERIETKLCMQGVKSGGARIQEAFRFHDKRGLGYLAENQFEQLLREKTGLSLHLSEREIKLVVEEVHDGSGAFEPQMLSKFISHPFTNAPHVMDEARNKALEALHAKHTNIETMPDSESFAAPGMNVRPQYANLLATLEARRPHHHVHYHHDQHRPSVWEELDGHRVAPRAGGGGGGHRVSAPALEPQLRGGGASVGGGSDFSFTSRTWDAALTKHRTGMATQSNQSPSGRLADFSGEGMSPRMARTMHATSPSMDHMFESQNLTSTAAAMVMGAEHPAISATRQPFPPPQHPNPTKPRADSGQYSGEAARFVGKTGVARQQSMDKYRKAMRQHHKTRKHLQHNQRLQEWQQEQEMRQFAADAARIRGRAGQQLDYFKRVQNREMPYPKTRPNKGPRGALAGGESRVQLTPRGLPRSPPQQQQQPQGGGGRFPQLSPVATMDSRRRNRDSRGGASGRGGGFPSSRIFDSPLGHGITPASILQMSRLREAAGWTPENGSRR